MGSEIHCVPSEYELEVGTHRRESGQLNRFKPRKINQQGAAQTLYKKAAELICGHRPTRPATSCSRIHEDAKHPSKASRICSQKQCLKSFVCLYWHCFFVELCRESWRRSDQCSGLVFAASSSLRARGEAMRWASATHCSYERWPSAKSGPFRSSSRG